MSGNIKALIVASISILLQCSATAQGFGAWNDLPFMVGNSSATNVLTSMQLLYDAFNGVSTNGLNRVTAWTNTASPANHAMDLVWITNINYAIAGTTNPTYIASGFNGHPCLSFWDGSKSSSLFTTNYCVDIPQPFTVIYVLIITNITGSPPFDHAIWSSDGDYDIGDQGFNWDGSTYHMVSWLGNASFQMLGGNFTSVTDPIVITTVYDGANSFIRTNGVTSASGNVGVFDFGNGGKGSTFAGFDFGATTGKSPIGALGRWGLWNSKLSTNDIQTVESKWRSDFGF